MLKYATTFRLLLPKEAILPLMPQIIRCLSCDSNVVHSYAALLLERLLALREGGPTGTHRYSPSDLSALLEPLMGGLFQVGSVARGECRDMRCGTQWSGGGLGPAGSLDVSEGVGES